MDYRNFLYGTLATSSVVLPVAWSYYSSSQKYHPGPPKLPIVGNLLQIPREVPWKTYQEWAKIYGPCVHLEVLGHQILVLNESKDAEELLSKRGLNNSERPHLVMAGDLVGFGRGLALLPYDDAAREARKLIHLTVGAKPFTSYYGLIESETMRYLCGLRDSPENVNRHLSYAAGAIILKIAYGYDVIPKDDPLVALANEALEKFSRTTLLGEFPVDLLPILQYVPSWFPGVQFKALAEEWRVLGKDLFDRPFNYVKEQIKRGTAAPSFAETHLQNLEEWNDHEIGSKAEIIKATATSLYAGAADTTVSAMRSFFLAMTIYQDVQRKAREEIDRVIGSGRLPTLADKADLPYCSSLVKEVLRWGVVGPLGIPHVAKVDDVYQGYNIAKGTIIVANIWAMLHDEKAYPNPFDFNPDRFAEGTQPDPVQYVFGFGRRACPGSHMAQSSMFLSMTQTLALFNIQRARDERGEEIIPAPEFVTGTISHPAPFQSKIIPREDRLHLFQDRTTMGTHSGE
ncbi:hypothetical protein FS842_008050 [Serendipita sp. 407]|nr:hypothetical protein FS842_008050 [Serendipita sp. 407]